MTLDIGPGHGAGGESSGDSDDEPLGDLEPLDSDFEDEEKRILEGEGIFFPDGVGAVDPELDLED